MCCAWKNEIVAYCGQGRVYLNITTDDSISVLFYLQITLRDLHGQENFTILISLMHHSLVFTTNRHNAWTHNAEFCWRRHMRLLWMQVSSSIIHALSNLWYTDWKNLNDSWHHNLYCSFSIVRVIKLKIYLMPSILLC